ncbi:MAG TPA: hypothetical protein DCE41_19460 [Cytophagales bacterium]|nr:hypothetical protein [Cytophagales bacterium]
MVAALVLVGCQPNTPTEALVSLDDIPHPSYPGLYKGSAPTPIGYTQQQAEEFLYSDEMKRLAVVMAVNGATNGVTFEEAEEALMKQVELIQAENPTYGAVAESHTVAFLVYEFFTIQPAKSEVNLESLSRYTEYMIEHTPEEIMNILPALVRLQGTWPTEQIGEASHRVVHYAKEAVDKGMSRHESVKNAAGRSTFYEDPYLVESEARILAQAEQVRFLEEWQGSL